MNKEKQTYLSPETETLVVQVEGVICNSPLHSVNGNNHTEYFGDSGYDEL